MTLALYVTPDGVVLDWSKIAITAIVVVVLSAFMTEGMAMISRAISRRRKLGPRKRRSTYTGPGINPKR